MKIAIILGTRPEIIKMAPIVRQCIKRGVDFFIIHTGQHYTHAMDTLLFTQLNVPEPRYNLHVGGYEYRKQVGIMVREISSILTRETPHVAIVQGDTNSVLAGALAANKTHIPLGHHEAGLRSHNLSMLEEINRIATDHIADHLFAPTKNAEQNLLGEGIEATKILLTGNTVVDVLQQHLPIAQTSTNILSVIPVRPQQYIFATAHRAENVDNPLRMQGIISGLSRAAAMLKVPVIYPIHPRTKKNIDRFHISIPDNIVLIDPIGYLESIQLEAHAKLIMTDSGGLQEEACILRVPCVTMRDETERPETIACGINIVAGTDPVIIEQAVRTIMNTPLQWNDIFGDGKAGNRIISHLLRYYSS